MKNYPEKIKMMIKSNINNTKILINFWLKVGNKKIALTAVKSNKRNKLSNQLKNHQNLKIRKFIKKVIKKLKLHL